MHRKPLCFHLETNLFRLQIVIVFVEIRGLVQGGVRRGIRCAVTPGPSCACDITSLVRDDQYLRNNCVTAQHSGRRAGYRASPYRHPG